MTSGEHERQAFVLHAPSQAGALSDREATEIKRHLEHRLAERLGLSAGDTATGTDSTQQQSWPTNSSTATDTSSADGTTADVSSDFGEDDSNEISMPDITNDDPDAMA